MRLLVVSTSFPKRPGDSLSPFIWEYCLSLARMGIEVTALVPHHSGLAESETHEGICIRRFKYLPERFENLAYSGGLLPGLKSSPLKGLKIPFFILSMYRAAREIIDNDRVDIVNFHWLFPACFWLGLLRRHTSIPFVLTGHGTDILLATQAPFQYFARKSLRKSSAVTLNSDYMKKILQPLNASGRIDIIPMGVDTEKFSPPEELSHDVRKILFAGRLIPQKGADLLLDAFNEIAGQFPDASLEIVGEGPEKNRLIEKAGRSGFIDKIVFSGAVDYGALVEKYRSAAMLALPSLVPEGLGMTAVEAASCGIPTVTFGLGGTSEFVINGKTGLVVDKGPAGLAGGILRLLRDSELRTRLGRSAREIVSRDYAWPVVAGKFGLLFESLM